MPLKKQAYMCDCWSNIYCHTDHLQGIGLTFYLYKPINFHILEIKSLVTTLRAVGNASGFHHAAPIHVNPHA